MRVWLIFIVGIVAGVALVAFAAEAYFQLGFAPVAANAAPMPFEKTLAKAALNRQADSAAQVPSPVQPTEENLLEGARNYREACAVCHSLPGRDKTDLEKGMYPPPPELLSGKGVTDDPVGRTHWVVQHGIRLTGMPSFENTFSDDQLWQLSLLLAHAHDLPPPVQDLLKSPDTISLDGLTGASTPLARR